MKFLQVLTGKRDAAVRRDRVRLTVAPGFREDAEAHLPRARLCESLRERLNVVPGSLLKVVAAGRAVNCRVGASATDDEGLSLVRLNPRARKLLGVELEHEVEAEVSLSPLSSSSVPLEVGQGLKGDERDAEPVVRLSKEMRKGLGLARGDYVNVRSGDHSLPARVEVGTRGDGSVARLNPMARGMLQVEVGDLIEVLPFETLVLLIDASGSMDEYLGFLKSKMDATREAIDRLIAGKARARERDLVGVVTFGEECELVSEPLDDFDLLTSRARNVRAYGRTAMFEGLAYTLELLEEAHGLRRIILLSDGCPTTTGSDLVLNLAGKARGMGVVIDTIGVGGGGHGREVSFDEALLRAVAELTGGKFSHVHEVRALEAEMELLGEAKKIPLLTAATRGREAAS
jgi:Mg-chelatase subunit ChlD